MFRNIGFRRQLGIVFSVGIFLLAFVTAVVVSNVSTQAMRERIFLESIKLTESLAEQSTLALLYESEENAAEVANIFSGFVDVSGVEVLTKEFSSLHRQGEFIGPFNNKAVLSGAPRFQSESSDVWEFSAPVILAETQDSEIFLEQNEASQGEVIGYVRLVITKDSLKRVAEKIFLYNIAVSMGLASALFIILLAISHRLLNPIHHLANTMTAAQSGMKVKQVALSGPSDIQKMFTAFNKMLEILDEREEELRKARDKAYELAQVKGQFAANVSHELRTPMNGVLGMLDMLGESDLSNKQHEYVTVAKNSAKALLSLINDILDFSKNDSGKTLLEQIEFDLYEDVEEAIALLGTQTQQKKIDLAYIIHEDVPRHYLGDTNRIRQLLINLMSNAIKFTSRGSVSVEISIDDTHTSEPDQVFLHFEVKDTGIGIPREKQTHIFEAFSQADGSTTRKFGGTGLGLSICKQIVELMQGEIGVDSTPGKGSSFWFKLPLKKDLKVHDRKLTLPRTDLCVLIVDRNLAIQRSLESILAQGGIEAHKANSYQSAVATIDRLLHINMPIDLLIVDAMLDGSRCAELIEYLASTQEQSARSLVLAHNPDNLVRAKERYNASEYLAKPVLSSHLMRNIDEFWKDEDVTPSVSNDTPKRESDIEFPDTRLLVVDDNPVNQLVAQGLLEPFRCEIDTATNGVECLTKLSQKKYDLIFMDCNMPEMDGFIASQKIREQEAEGEHIAIIAITANAREEDREKCIASGMDDYLLKPFSRDDLKGKLTQWLAVSDQANHK